MQTGPIQSYLTEKFGRGTDQRPRVRYTIGTGYNPKAQEGVERLHKRLRAYMERNCVKPEDWIDNTTAAETDARQNSLNGRHSAYEWLAFPGVPANRELAPRFVTDVEAVHDRDDRMRQLAELRDERRDDRLRARYETMMRM